MNFFVGIFCDYFGRDIELFFFKTVVIVDDKYIN